MNINRDIFSEELSRVNARIRQLEVDLRDNIDDEEEAALVDEDLMHCRARLDTLFWVSKIGE